MAKNLVEQRKQWRNCNVSTIEFAKNIPEHIWSERAFGNRFKSFAWEMACITRTRICYLNALKTGKLAFARQVGIPDKNFLENESKGQSVKRLSSLAREILKEIEVSRVENKVEFLSWLMQHERIHQGKLLLYFSYIKLKLPKSFIKTWGRENFES